MKHFLALSALLAASAVLTECSIFKRLSEPVPVVVTPPPVDKCQECVEVNLDKHQPRFGSDQDAVNTLSNRTSLELVAADIQRAAGCVQRESAKSNCRDDWMHDNWVPLQLIAQYLKTSAHLDLIQAAAASTDCITNTTTSEAAGLSILMCYFSFMEHIQQDPCPALQSLQTCTVMGVSSNCGDAAGEFIQSVWDFVAAPEVHSPLLGMLDMSELSGIVHSCQQQANLVKRFAKRALETLRK